MPFPGLPLLPKHLEELSDQVDRGLEEGQGAEQEQEGHQSKAQTDRENKRVKEKIAVGISFQLRWI